MARRRLRTIFLAMAMALAFALAVSSAAHGQERPTSRKVVLDFDDTPMEEVLRHFSNLFKQNYIIVGDVDGKAPLTVITATPVGMRDAHLVLEAALAANGLTLERSGRFWKVISAADAQPPINQAGPKRPGALASTPEGETRLVPIAHADAAQLGGVLERVASSRTRIVVHPQSNALIVIGPDSDFARLERIIAALDRPEAESKIHFYKLQHADAEELGRVLSEIGR